MDASGDQRLGQIVSIEPVIEPATLPGIETIPVNDRSSTSGRVVTLASIALVVLQLALGAALWFGVQRQGDATHQLHVFEDAKSTLLQVIRGANEIVVTDGSSAAREMLVVALKKFASMDSSVGFKRALESTKINWPTLNKRLAAFAARENIGTSDVDSLIELGKLSFESGALVDWLDRETDTIIAAASTAQMWLNGILGVSIVTLLLSTAGYFLTFRWRVTRPLQRAVTIAERISSRDLTPLGAADLHDSGEASALMSALARVTENLGRLVTRVRTEVDQVRVDSHQIAQGNSSLSLRTEQQAAALEETAASMEQMTATVSKNSDNANEASRLAVQAATVASRGGVAVQAVISTMAEITSSSKKISDIIGVIDSIAFQTNILALNAAVEAARAGERGRGFAVVAAEVRTLALRSSTAAKEIKSLITESVAMVEMGSQQVGIAGNTTTEIISAANAVRALIESIAAASQEQLHGIRQASEAVVQLETVTHQNAAMVEESNAMAKDKADRTEELANLVAQFTTGALADPSIVPLRPAREKRATDVEKIAPPQALGQQSARLANRRRGNC